MSVFEPSLVRPKLRLLPGFAITALGIATALGSGVLVYRFLERPLARFSPLSLLCMLTPRRPVQADS